MLLIINNNISNSITTNISSSSSSTGKLYDKLPPRLA